MNLFWPSPVHPRDRLSGPSMMPGSSKMGEERSWRQLSLPFRFRSSQVLVQGSGVVHAFGSFYQCLAFMGTTVKTTPTPKRFTRFYKSSHQSRSATARLLM
eukprot:348815-Pelagomonas_calceolata.AAC.2